MPRKANEHRTPGTIVPVLVIDDLGDGGSDGLVVDFVLTVVGVGVLWV